MKKAFFPAILPAFLLFSLAVAADTRVTEVHPLGLATADTAYELVQGLVSPGGRAVLDEGHNAIIVLDAPETQQAVRELLQGMQTPLPQIRIESRIVDNESGRPAKVSASGQLVASVPPGEASGSVFFNVGDGSTSSSRAAEQFVVVASGGEAFISVGKEIPYLEWFAAYGEGLGILTPGIEWREVGSRLEVKATAIDGGRKVRLRAVPQLEYLVGGTRKRKGRRQETAFAGVAAEVVLESGDEVRLGGGEEKEEFYSRFLSGYDRQRRVRKVDIYIRATVLPDARDRRGVEAP